MTILCWKKVQQNVEEILVKNFKTNISESLAGKLSQLSQVGEALAKDVFEQLQTQKSRRMLDYALDVVRPHFLSLGLKVTRFHRLFCEIKIPAKARNVDEHGYIIESVVIGAGLEAFRLLWKRHLTEANLLIHFRTLNFVKHKAVKGALFARFELPEITREAHMAELAKTKRTEHEAVIYFYDENEQRVSELQVLAELTAVEMLEWK